MSFSLSYLGVGFSLRPPGIPYFNVGFFLLSFYMMIFSFGDLADTSVSAPGYDDRPRSSGESLQGPQPHNRRQEGQRQSGLLGCQTPQHADR